MRTQRSGNGIRLLIGLAIAIFSIISFFASSQFNPITGEQQHLSLTPEQEISLGLQSKPEMIAENGGLYRDQQVQDQIDTIGENLVNGSLARDTPWEFDFNVLDSSDVVNAFALPGGPVFITTGLLSHLTTEDQVAGVLAHEITHVLARHSAQQIAKSNLTNGLIGAVSVASGDASTAQTAAMIGQLVNMKYGRDDETQSDTLGVCWMIDAGYNPQGMIEVMQVLEEVSGGSRQPEFFSTHPNPENRIVKIQEAIDNADSRCPKQ
ncbi:MAG TPA: M48 family metallopeptidase [Phototrophicaceae bacterium]|jgi:predicted Zn-dependent protease|nr:M48 family metallopeptidase [Phototrophicaceae bacterium]